VTDGPREERGERTIPIVAQVDGLGLGETRSVPGNSRRTQHRIDGRHPLSSGWLVSSCLRTGKRSSWALDGSVIPHRARLFRQAIRKHRPALRTSNLPVATKHRESPVTAATGPA